MKRTIYYFCRQRFFGFPLAMICMALMGCTKAADDIIIPPASLTLDAFYTGYISSTEQDNGVVWTWSLLPDNMQMDITITCNGIPYCHETTRATTLIQKDLDTNVRYDYLFRLFDGTHYSDAIMKTYTRQGATKPQQLCVEQQEGTDAYELLVSWTPSYDATEILLKGTNGIRMVQETLKGDATTYTIDQITDNETWTFELTALNEKGSSLPVTTIFKSGKQKVAFLSQYASPEECVNMGDDDEASAWLWFHETYPNSKFLSASDIKATEDLADYRVLFYIRDIDSGNEDDAWNQPVSIQQATPYIREWYKAGGNMVLWQHAVAFITDLGRMDRDMMRSVDHRVTIGNGSWNGGIWHMAVQINPGSYFVEDFSSHPLYKDVDVRTDGRSKYVTVKGPAWTEDHNIVFHNLPSLITGYNNQDPRCYDALTEIYGIYPLGVWDSQIDWVSQLNVWEARQGNTECRGTLLCIGNGGCEFSYKNSDGTPDKNAYPHNSQYQSNVLKMARNAIEYLKTR
ncbi:DUF4960 domain-containing protein [Prevotella sp. E13-17]|uniref:DUF4960 domain-containing protein n=1 Tax=Prevotella sp. E13-17 TaxID=2913616 RepID=UPI001EDABE10|nr:DUF4960 domain-containing protein [Prevotella sp. E13-17]UKK51029.1 DUF4960 domain-containing protein [Prevotella sp. E13-17]